MNTAHQLIPRENIFPDFFMTRISGHCMRTARTQLFFAAIFLLMLPSLRAQTQAQTERFRLAQVYEQNGDPEAAAMLYTDLLAASPKNDAYFSGVARTFLALKRYDTLAVITRQRIASFGSSVGLFSLLGRALYHAGHEADAAVAWDSAMNAAAANDRDVRRVTDDMIASHAYQSALDAYARAARTMHNDLLFAADRANLYALLSRYKDATEIYVQMMIANQMPLALVENRLSYYTIIDEGQRVALDVVRAASQEHSDVIDLQYLFAWLLMERKDYAGAFDVYLAIDDKRNAGGQELVQFASRALSDGVLDVAFKAFEKVKRRAANESVAGWADFGAASVHEQLWKRNFPDSISLAHAIADEYEEIATHHPNSIWADSSVLRGAKLRAFVLFDPEGAATRLRALLGRNTRLARSGEPELMLAELFIAENKLDSAAITAVRVFQGRGIGPNAEQHSRFLLGKLRYFAGDFDSAAAIFKECTELLNAPYANDAIEMESIIQENKDSSGREALRMFAAADLAALQNQFPRAIAGLNEIVITFATRSIAESAIETMGEDYAATHQYVQSRDAYQRLLDKYPESILRDRAQMRIAGLLEGPLHDPAAAIHAYEMLLQNFPSSIFLQDARERIRSLRANVN